MNEEIEYDMSLDHPVRCRAKRNAEPFEGLYYGYVVIKGRRWAIVLEDGKDDPDLFKAEHLEIEERRFVSIP